MRKIDVNKIIPYENNPRKNEAAIEIVMKSIEEFGFRNPIVLDKNNVIIVGHTRFEASKRLGYTEVPCIIADDLTEEQVKAFRIMDNKSGEFSEWDIDKLTEEINSLIEKDYDVDYIGFDEEEIIDMLNDLEDVQEEGLLEKEDVELKKAIILKVKKYNIELSDEEYMRFEDFIKQYSEENKVLYGFINRVMDLIELGLAKEEEEEE